MSRVLVLVHGAGKQPTDYAAAPLHAISLLLGYEPRCIAVYYADIGNVDLDLRPMTAAPDSAAEMQFKISFMAQVQKDVGSIPRDPGSVSAAWLGPDLLADLIATEVNQIAGYLFRTSIYSEIQARMSEGLSKAAELGDELIVVAHSLGSVVAFDSLRAVAAPARVATLITLGCPLAKLRRLGIRSGGLGHITYDRVAEWQNWYDTTDPLSNPLGPSFPYAGYRLRDIFVDIAPLPPASHDYFSNGEVLAGVARTLGPLAMTSAGRGARGEMGTS